jgi:AcrR family transcriptional regulator
MGQTAAKERKRLEILEAALGVFGSYGYRGGSLDKIAEKANVTKGALYWHFKNKSDLYMATCDFAFEEYGRALQAGLDQESDPRAALESVAQAALSFYQQNELVTNFYSTMMLESQLLLEEDMVKRTAKAYEGYRSIFSVLIEAGVKSGSFRRVDPNVVASAFIAVLDGIVIQWMVDKQNVRLLETGLESIRMLLKGIEK